MFNVTFDSEHLEWCEQYWYLAVRMEGKEAKNKEPPRPAAAESGLVANEESAARRTGP